MTLHDFGQLKQLQDKLTTANREFDVANAAYIRARAERVKAEQVLDHAKQEMKFALELWEKLA